MEFLHFVNFFEIMLLSNMQTILQENVKHFPSFGVYRFSSFSFCSLINDYWWLPLLHEYSAIQNRCFLFQIQSLHGLSGPSCDCNMVYPLSDAIQKGICAIYSEGRLTQFTFVVDLLYVHMDFIYILSENCLHQYPVCCDKSNFQLYSHNLTCWSV